MSERSAVQNPMLKYAAEIGWESISASDALQKRHGDKGFYFADVLEAQLMRLNWGVLDEARCKEIARRLNLLNPTLREIRTRCRGCAESSRFLCRPRAASGTLP